MEEENCLDEIVGKTVGSVIYDNTEEELTNKELQTRRIIICFKDGTAITLEASYNYSGTASLIHVKESK